MQNDDWHEFLNLSYDQLKSKYDTEFRNQYWKLIEWVYRHKNVYKNEEKISLCKSYCIELQDSIKQINQKYALLFDSNSSKKIISIENPADLFEIKKAYSLLSEIKKAFLEASSFDAFKKNLAREGVKECKLRDYELPKNIQITQLQLAQLRVFYNFLGFENANFYVGSGLGVAKLNINFQVNNDVLPKNLEKPALSVFLGSKFRISSALCLAIEYNVAYFGKFSIFDSKSIKQGDYFYKYLNNSLPFMFLKSKDHNGEAGKFFTDESFDAALKSATNLNLWHQRLIFKLTYSL